MLRDDREHLELEKLQIETRKFVAASTVLRREIAELDAQMSAKESFSSRVGLLPFVAGAGVAMAAIVVFQYFLHL